MSSAGDGSAEPAVSYRALLSDPRLLSATMLSAVGSLGVNVASPALPSMGLALGVSDARIGLVITAYTLPAMVMVPVTGVVADVYGRRRVVIPALVLFGAAGTAIAAAGSFEAVLVLRAIQGVAFAGIMPLSVTILGDLYHGATGSAAQGLRVGMNGVSSTIAPAVAGVLAAVAWGYPFLVFALALPVAALLAVFLPETASTGAGRGALGGQLRGYARSLAGELGDRRLSTLLLGGGVRDFVRYGIITFVPLFAVRSMDASLAQAGALLSVRGFAYVVISPLAGAIVGRVSRRWALVGSLGLTAAGTALLPAAPNVLALAGLVFVYSAGDSVFSPVIKDAVTDVVGESSRAGVVGGMNVLKYGAQTAAPVAFGAVLAVAGFDALFAVAAAIVAGYAVGLAAVVR